VRNSLASQNRPSKVGLVTLDIIGVWGQILLRYGSAILCFVGSLTAGLSPNPLDASSTPSLVIENVAEILQNVPWGVGAKSSLLGIRDLEVHGGE
jgi:hypothetical protein